MAALPGFTIVRAVLPGPVPLGEGFAAVERHLKEAGRPLEALCGMELRMPRALDRQGFIDFNSAYVAQLRAWGLLRDGAPPLARTNVIPVADPPPQTGVLAFSYTVPDGGDVPAYVVSGAAEVPAGAGYPEGIVRPGETGQEAMAAKTASIVGDILDCLAGLGVPWTPAAQVHLYSPHTTAATAAFDGIAGLAGVAPAHGIVWHRARPPVTGLEMEIDVRRHRDEIAADRPVSADRPSKRGPAK
ncbi:2-amino-5-chloromuconate deaminase CnbZ [Thermocatellispora tengchongensis]|uniref:2-amino-5-chloromuconate deaminase CnbZ n=1 Tax=Thermocatellispora tengchongensis TaxID=1073253 RepID=UPI00363F885F